MNYLDRAAGLVDKLRSAGFEGAIVAGGFLRDSYLGLPPKDIDIFVPRQGFTTQGFREALEVALGDPFLSQSDMSYSEGEVARIFTTGASLTDLEVQVIELHEGLTPVERAMNHDFGLCQVWVGGYGLEATPAWVSDVRNQTCTLIHCENDSEHARSMRRWERLKEKLVGFRLVDQTQWAI